MSYLVLYLIFAVATALSSIYEIFWPLVSKAKSLGIKNDFTASPYLSTFVVLLINMLFAPLVFLILVLPGATNSAFNGLSKVVFEEQEI